MFNKISTSIVAIGLINHNVTYLLSSEISFSTDGQYKPMPFRAGTSPKHTEITDQQQTDHIASTIHNQVATNGLSLSQSPRSRSNSYVSTSGTMNGAQRLEDDIEEEQSNVWPQLSGHLN